MFVALILLWYFQFCPFYIILMMSAVTMASFYFEIVYQFHTQRNKVSCCCIRDPDTKRMDSKLLWLAFLTSWCKVDCVLMEMWLWVPFFTGRVLHTGVWSGVRDTHSSRENRGRCQGRTLEFSTCQSLKLLTSKALWEMTTCLGMWRSQDRKQKSVLLERS